MFRRLVQPFRAQIRLFSADLKSSHPEAGKGKFPKLGQGQGGGIPIDATGVTGAEAKKIWIMQPAVWPLWFFTGLGCILAAYKVFIVDMSAPEVAIVNKKHRTTINYIENDVSPERYRFLGGKE